MAIRPDLRINELGAKALSPLLGEDVTGRAVTVRDWYGEVTIACTGVEIGRSGYPAALELEHEGARRAFSLHSAREIEVVVE